MANTALGAAKLAAKHYNLSLDEYFEKLKTEKACKKCKQWKNRVEFCKDKGSKDGLSKICFTCRRVKIKKCTKGRTTWMKGKTHSEESKIKIKNAHLNKPKLNLHRIGAKHTDETKKEISRKHKLLNKKGSNNPNWKGGHSYFSENEKIRRSQEYKEWRKAVYERDNYICQMCGDARGGNLHAHHLKSFAKYLELRFVVENGMTVCDDCHCTIHKTSTVKRKRNGRKNNNFLDA